MKKILIGTFILSFSLGSIAYSSTYEEVFLNISKNSSKELLTTLKSSLDSALATGDTKAAVETCSVIGQSIAKGISDKNNISIKRVSLKNRNPNGKPDSFEKESLIEFDNLKNSNTLKPSHETFSIVNENGVKYFRYMKPIVTAKTCLQCHGNPEQIKEEVKSTLLKNYPKDLATGYKEGDVRGAVSVKIKI